MADVIDFAEKRAQKLREKIHLVRNQVLEEREVAADLVAMETLDGIKRLFNGNNIDVHGDEHRKSFEKIVEGVIQIVDEHFGLPERKDESE